MATRSGSVDPGLLLHLLRHGTSVDELDDLLERRSGVLGLSGVSADLREVIAARDRGDERARLAVDVFVHRLVTGIGAMIGALGGLDASSSPAGSASTAPRSGPVPSPPSPGSAPTSTTMPTPAASGDADVSAPDARVRILVVTAREDLVIARAARALTGEVTGPK